MKVVIVAGGKGTRISSISSEIPKAMIPVQGKPVLEYQVELARRYGHKEFIFVIGHLGEQIRRYFGDGEKWGVSIEYYEESRPLGTAGALFYLKDRLPEDFFVFYGDTVMDFDMDRMVTYHSDRFSDATLFLHPNDHPYDSDIIELDPSGLVVRFHNKPHPADLVVRNIVNAAVFILSPRILSYVEQGIKSHIEKDLLPRCLEHGMKLYGYVSAEYIKDMGTPERYRAVCDDVASGKVAKMNRCYKRPAIFLDRDGTVSKEVNLLFRADQLELITGAARAIRLINDSGYLAVLVTNQPVIARNLCSIEELNYIHSKLETLLGDAGAYLNAIYYCPHHPDRGYPEERAEYKISCNCRKPRPGMLFRAAEDWNIDLGQSYMIGDREADVAAGLSAGCKGSYRIATNEANGLLNLIMKILVQDK